MTKIIDDSLLDELTRRAQNSPRLRTNRRQAERRYKLVCSLPRHEGVKVKLNYNFHQSLEEFYGSWLTDGLLNKLAGRDRRPGSMIHGNSLNSPDRIT